LKDWAEGLDPIKPVIKGDKLYGRGGADDGYSFFGSVLCVKALDSAGIKHGRCILMFEGDEESGSDDLPHYFHALKERIGKLDVLICLDSGCVDYKHFCITTTLRGVLNVALKVEVLKSGIHGGDCSVVIPSSFRIQRLLLDRIDNLNTGLVREEF